MSVSIILKSLSIFIAITLVNGKANLDLTPLKALWRVTSYGQVGSLITPAPKCMKVDITAADATSITATLTVTPTDGSSNVAVTVNIINIKTTGDNAIESTITGTYTSSGSKTKTGTGKLIFYSSNFMYWTWTETETSNVVTLILSRYKSLSADEEKVPALTGAVKLTDGSCSTGFSTASTTTADDLGLAKNWFVVGAVNGAKELPDYKLWNVTITPGDASALYKVTSSALADKEDEREFTVTLHSSTTKGPMFKISTTDSSPTHYYASRVDSITDEFTYWKIYEKDDLKELAVGLFLKSEAKLSSAEEVVMKTLIAAGTFKEISHKWEEEKSDKDDKSDTSKPTPKSSGSSPSTTEASTTTTKPSKASSQFISFSMLLLPFLYACL